MEPQAKISGSELYLANWKVARQEFDILLVNGSRVYLEGLQLLLDHETGQQEWKFHIIQNISLEEVTRLGEQSNLATRFSGQNFDLILLSMVQSNFSLSLQAANCLRQAGFNCPLLWLDMPNDSRKIINCIKSGGSGFVLEDEPPERVYNALTQVLRGERVCPPAALGYLFEQVAFIDQIASMALLQSGTEDQMKVELTRREMEVLNAMMEALSNREIAQKLTIEVRTVKNHTHNILRKLQATNRREAILRAVQLNLLSKTSGSYANLNF
jgi:DNA-binding NarL/FixJ family response regulator